MAKKEISRPATAHIPPFGLRLQPDLKERIDEAAREAGRSINAEIADRLERSFEQDDLPLLARAVARLEYSLATEEGKLHVTNIELANFGRWVADFLESKEPSQEDRAKLLLAARSYGSSLKEAGEAALETMGRLKELAARIPGGNRQSVMDSLELQERRVQRLKTRGLSKEPRS